MPSALAMARMDWPSAAALRFPRIGSLPARELSRQLCRHEFRASLRTVLLPCRLARVLSRNGPKARVFGGVVVIRCTKMESEVEYILTAGRPALLCPLARMVNDHHGRPCRRSLRSQFWTGSQLSASFSTPARNKVLTLSRISNSASPSTAQALPDLLMRRGQEPIHMQISRQDLIVARAPCSVAMRRNDFREPVALDPLQPFRRRCA